MPKAKKLSDIAEEYGTCEKTLRNKLRELNVPYKRGYNFPVDQKIIYEALGYPEGVDPKDYENIITTNNKG